MARNFKRRLPLGEQLRENAGLLESLGGKRQLVEEILAIFLAGCAVFIAFSLVSYDGLSREGLPSTGGWTGVAGSYMAFAVFQLLGAAAYAVPPMAGTCAVLLFLQKRRLLGPLRIALALVALGLMTGLLHVLLSGRTFLGGHLPGGAAGLWLGNLLVPVFARAGTMLILSTFVVILLILVAGTSTRRGWVLLWICLKAVAGLVWRAAAAVVAVFRRSGDEEEAEAEAAPVEIEPEIVVEDEPPPVEEPAEADAPPDEAGPKKQPPRRRRVPPRPSGFKLPPFDILKEPPKADKGQTKEQIRSIDQKLIDTLWSYGIKGEVTGVHPGPVVTTYEFRPEKGTKISSITSREDDITMSLEAYKVRIVAPIPGKNAVGFEIPNPSRTTVYLRELIQDPAFDRTRKKIPLALGKDITGRPYLADLDKMPHLLIAGTTGSGKSVSINAMLVSLLYSFTPDEMQFILIDPKQVEMQTYGGIPHLLLPVVTDPKKAALALKWAVDEMERRYQLFATSGSKDLQSYNKRVREKDGATEKDAGPPPDAEQPPGAESPPQPAEPLPYVIIVIDELADLMMAAVRDVEWSITRLAQKARAAGIHLIVATQRPSVNVVTGLIKANFPCRVAFRVAAKVDSRVMLDHNGAETLLGDGDMLIVPPGTSDLVRVQGAFVSEDEIRSVASFLREQGTPSYKEEILSGRLEEDSPLAEDEDGDEYYDAAVTLVLSERKASVSYLQRRFSIGYNRAARIMERMERDGIVGPSSPGKPYREVLMQSPP
jgi:S-DNA-T family DNA segregation ATPase FtsK/SpoIIIE